MMAENYCYTRESALVKALAGAGLFGETYYGEGAYVHELKELHEATPWRRFWQVGVDGNTYPTHSLGPVLSWMDINCGDRFDFAVAMATRIFVSWMPGGAPR